MEKFEIFSRSIKKLCYVKRREATMGDKKISKDGARKDKKKKFRE